MNKNTVWVILIAFLLVVFIGIGIIRKGSTDQSNVIGVIPKETASPFWKAVQKGAQVASEEVGYTINWQGPDSEINRERQIQIVQDMITLKVAGIVLAPNDKEALVPIVNKVYEEGIPCVIIDSGLNTDKYLSYMATDNYKGGVLAAERMGKLLSSKGKIIVVTWTPSAASTEARFDGFKDTLEEKFPEIEIVASQYPNPPTKEVARAVTEDMLTTNAQVDAIFACNETTAVGALMAIRNQAFSARNIMLIGFDASETLVDGLENGDLDSLVVQNPYKMGYEGVKAIAAKMQDKEVPKVVDTGVELVTDERLQEPEIKELLDMQCY